MTDTVLSDSKQIMTGRLHVARLWVGVTPPDGQGSRAFDRR